MVQCMSNSKVYKTDDFNLQNKTYGILDFLALMKMSSLMKTAAFCK